MSGSLIKNLIFKLACLIKILIAFQVYKKFTQTIVFD